MLSFLRKHTGLIMFVLAFIFVGLAFFGDNMAPSAPGSGGKIMTSKNGSYNEKEYQILGHSGGQLAAGLPSLQPMFMAMTSAPGMGRAEIPAFFANRIILREEAKRLGLVPSLDQVEDKIRGMVEFQDENGQYSPDIFKRFVTRQLGSYGLSETEFLDLVKDKLSFDRLTALLTSGISLDSKTQEDLFNSLVQKLNVKTATLSLADFKNGEEVSEETLKEFWTPRQKKYMSDETRTATVYTLTPKKKAEKVEGVSIPQSTQEVGAIAESIWDEVINKRKGHDFKQVIKEISNTKGDLLTLTEEKWDNISKNKLPENLKKTFNKAAGQQGSLGDAIFAIRKGAEGTENISNVLIMEDGSVVLFLLEGIVESEPLKFEQARAAALADYQTEKNIASMELAAEKLRQDLVAGLAEKKDFDQIAQTAKAKVSTVNELSMSDPVNQDLFYAARLVNPNHVTKVVKRGNDRIIAELVENVIVDSPETAAERSNFKKYDSNNASILLFQDWFANQFRNRNIEFTELLKKQLRSENQ